jgi:hypothetical protein
VIEPMRTARVGFLVISTKAEPPGTLVTVFQAFSR